MTGCSDSRIGLDIAEPSVFAAFHRRWMTHFIALIYNAQNTVITNARFRLSVTAEQVVFQHTLKSSGSSHSDCRNNGPSEYRTVVLMISPSHSRHRNRQFVLRIQSKHSKTPSSNCSRCLWRQQHRSVRRAKCSLLYLQPSETA